MDSEKSEKPVLRIVIVDRTRGGYQRGINRTALELPVEPLVIPFPSRFDPKQSEHSRPDRSNRKPKRRSRSRVASPESHILIQEFK